MSEPEFYANATLGFRKWHFSLRDDEENEPILLEGMYKYNFHEPLCRWDLLEPNHAECLRLKFGSYPSAKHGEVPEPGCGCGFYAYGRRDGSNSETTVHMVGGVVAGWGNLELHERGFRCGVARILALFAPAPRNTRPCDSPYYKELTARKWPALRRMCADNGIPLLEPDALREEDELRRYACERDLVLLKDQLSFGETPARISERSGSSRKQNPSRGSRNLQRDNGKGFG